MMTGMVMRIGHLHVQYVDRYSHDDRHGHENMQYVDTVMSTGCLDVQCEYGDGHEDRTVPRKVELLLISSLGSLLSMTCIFELLLVERRVCTSELSNFF
jgi:hypothetical protein